MQSAQQMTCILRTVTMLPHSRHYILKLKKFINDEHNVSILYIYYTTIIMNCGEYIYIYTLCVDSTSVTATNGLRYFSTRDENESIEGGEIS